MILRFPEGYDTRVGSGGHHLSQGQQKAISLARSFYNNLVLLVLDEPSANLDQGSLLNFLKGLKNQKSEGSVIIFSTHDTRLLSLADNIILLGNRTLKMMSTSDYLRSISPEAGRLQGLKSEAQ